MGIGRFAGDALSFLADNALTRSWQGSMDRYVTGPIGRRQASDETLQYAVPGMVGGLNRDEALRPLMLDAAVKLLGTDKTPEQVVATHLQRVATGTADPDLGKYLAGHMDKVVEEGRVERGTLEGVAAMVAQATGGRYGLTQAGSNVRQFVTGSPVAAYGAVLGGGALAVKGAMDVYARMQAGQPVSEEEKMAADQVLNQVGQG
jgi:hypothetical protein